MCSLCHFSGLFFCPLTFQDFKEKPWCEPPCSPVPVLPPLPSAWGPYPLSQGQSTGNGFSVFIYTKASLFNTLKFAACKTPGWHLKWHSIFWPPCFWREVSGGFCLFFCCFLYLRLPLVLPCPVDAFEMLSLGVMLSWLTVTCLFVLDFCIYLAWFYWIFFDC